MEQKLFDAAAKLPETHAQLDTSQMKTTFGYTNSVRRVVLTLAACAAAICIILFGAIGLTAEVNEYQTAIAYFSENGLSTDGLSRKEIKTVYTDIITGSFTHPKTAGVLASMDKVYSDTSNLDPHVQEMYQRYFDTERTHTPEDYEISMITNGMSITEVIEILGKPHNFGQTPDGVSLEWETSLCWRFVFYVTPEEGTENLNIFERYTKHSVIDGKPILCDPIPVLTRWNRENYGQYFDPSRTRRPAEADILSITPNMHSTEVVNLIGKPHGVYGGQMGGLLFLWQSDEGRVYGVEFLPAEDAPENLHSTILFMEHGVVASPVTTWPPSWYIQYMDPKDPAYPKDPADLLAPTGPDDPLTPTGPNDHPTEPQSPTAPTDPVSPTDPPEPVDPEVAAMQELLEWKGTKAFYNDALISDYSSPEDVNLYYLFYDGFKDEAQFPTDEEATLLEGKMEEYWKEMDLIRLPAEKIDAVLMELFGITLEQTNKVGLEKLVYLEETDCYYQAHSATHYAEVTVQQVVHQQNGTIWVYYYRENTRENMVVALKPNGDSYQILSNQPEIEHMDPEDAAALRIAQEKIQLYELYKHIGICCEYEHAGYEDMSRFLTEEQKEDYWDYQYRLLCCHTPEEVRAHVDQLVTKEANLGYPNDKLFADDKGNLYVIVLPTEHDGYYHIKVQEYSETHIIAMAESWGYHNAYALDTFTLQKIDGNFMIVSVEQEKL